MIYRIDAHNGVEAGVLERKPFSRIALIKISAGLKPQFLCIRFRIGHPFLDQINA